jgi:3-hydroxyisobutyrate dehydrogenase-like beta-hydroxyacid dehydrogenase
VAVLAPVNPARLAVPLLLAGAAAGRAEVLLRVAGFTNTRVVGEEVGRASAIKMIRSVMVKGIEALTVEMMLAAEAAGVADEVLASLEASEQAQPWRQRAAYNIERMVTHGARRAAEMAESARTLSELGIEPVMTEGTVRRQAAMAGRKDLLLDTEGDRP